MHQVVKTHKTMNSVFRHTCAGKQGQKRQKNNTVFEHLQRQKSLQPEEAHQSNFVQQCSQSDGTFWASFAGVNARNRHYARCILNCEISEDSDGADHLPFWKLVERVFFPGRRPEV